MAEKDPSSHPEAPRLVMNIKLKGGAVVALSGIEQGSVPETAGPVIHMGRKNPQEVLSDTSEMIKENIGDVRIEGGEGSAELSKGLSSFVDAKVTGLKHVSRKEIQEFDEREYRRKGTFGSGLYLGANSPIASTDLGVMRSGEHFEHEVELKGNILTIDLLDDNAYWRAGSKLPPELQDEFHGDGTDFAGASMLMEHPLDGIMYDAVIFHTRTETADGPIIQTEAIVRDPHKSATIISSQHYE